MQGLVRCLRTLAEGMFPRRTANAQPSSTWQAVFARLAARQFMLHSLFSSQLNCVQIQCEWMGCFEQHQNESNKQKSIELGH
jgi:hypothetical protein